jgi:hypothetical protein
MAVSPSPRRMSTLGGTAPDKSDDPPCDHDQSQFDAERQGPEYHRVTHHEQNHRD